MSDYSVYATFAAEIIAAAGGLARRRFFRGKHNITRKDGGEKVTESDCEVEDFIRDQIHQKYPQHGFWGEESGQNGDMSNCWIVDPIDGTTNFIHKYPNCGISLAYCEKQKTRAAAIHDIVGNETFTAIHGEGAFAEGRRLRVSAAASVDDSVFIAGGSMNNDFWPLIRSLMRNTDGMRRSGSTVLDLANVAAGRMDMLVCGPVRYWDVAAGALIMREAGGLLLDAVGNTTFPFGEPTTCFIAGAPKVFPHYATALKKHFDAPR